MNKFKNLFVYFYFISILYFVNTKLDKITIMIHISMVIYLFIRSRKIYLLDTPFKWFLVLIPYTLLIHIIFSTYDLLVDKRLIRIIIFSYGIYAFVKLFENRWENILRIFINILFINTIMTYIQYFNILGLRYKTLALTTSIKEYWYVAYRAMGLMDGYDLNGIVLACYTVIIFIYLINNKNITLRRRVGLLFMCSTSFIGIFFAARTGLIAFISLVIIMSILSAKIIITKLIKILGGLLTIFISSAIGFNMLGEEVKAKINESIAFVFEAIINYIKYGEISTNSTTDLITNHYFIPETTTHLIFGNGLGINSDSGYIQIIFKVGIIGLIVYLAIYIYILIKNIRVIKFQKDNNLIKWLAKFNVAAIITLLIICSKGPYFYSERLLIILIYSISIIEIVGRRKYENDNINNNSNI